MVTSSTALLAVTCGTPTVLRNPRLKSVLLEVAREPRIAEGCGRALADAGFLLAQQWDQRDGRPIPGVLYGLFVRKPAE